MLKKSLLTLIGLALCFSVFSQSRIDTMEFKKASGGYTLGKDGRVLSYNEMISYMRIYPEACSYMENARGKSITAGCFGIVGGLSTLVCLLNVANDNPNWGFTAISVGVLFISIPISSSATKDAASAVKLFNNKNGVSSSQSSYLNMGLTSNGLRLQFNF